MTKGAAVVEIALINKPFLLTRPGTRACLLLHGLGGGVYEMLLLAEVLYKQGLTVCGINYPGHDRPATLMPRSTWQDWYGHILDTYRDLSRSYQTITVIGFSTGCPLALHLVNQTQHQPRYEAEIYQAQASQSEETEASIDRLVLLGPYLSIRYHWYYGFPLETYVQTIGRAIEQVPRLSLPIRDREMERAAKQAAFFQSFNLYAVRSAIELIETYAKPVIPRVTVPTLIMQAQRDRVVDPSGAQYIYDTIASSDKELVWLPESDHIIPLDVERETVFEKVAGFLS
ncbi:MAG: alpha/beta fold hydrolase [Cyanobacteria bacterium P01_E01_bin.34]